VRKKPPKPDEDGYSDYLRRLWKTATPDKIFKDRLKINIKKDPLARDSSSKDSKLSISNKNLSSSTKAREEPKKEGSTRSSTLNITDPRDPRNPKTSSGMLFENSSRPREPSNAPPDRRRERSRAPPERDDRGRDRERERSRSRTSSPERLRESTSTRNLPSSDRDRDRDRARDGSRPPSDRNRDASRSREGSSRSFRDIPRSRDSSVGPPQDRDRSRSSRYDDRDRSMSRDRERSLSSRDRDGYRSSSRPRDYDREDRGRDDRVRDDRSVSRSRSGYRSSRDDDDGYRSSRDMSRSPSRPMRDPMDRSRSRSSSRGDYYPYDRPAMEMMVPRMREERTVNREIDTLLRRYENLNVKTTQKSQERQLLFVAIAFFIGFIFAQGVLY